MNFTVIVLSGIDRNLSIALSVSSAWNPPFIRLLGPPLYFNLKYIQQSNVNSKLEQTSKPSMFT